MVDGDAVVVLGWYISVSPLYLSWCIFSKPRSHSRFLKVANRKQVRSYARNAGGLASRALALLVQRVRRQLFTAKEGKAADE